MSYCRRVVRPHEQNSIRPLIFKTNLSKTSSEGVWRGSHLQDMDSILGLEVKEIIYE